MNTSRIYKEYDGIIIVIPSRNRAAIAESAIRSVLEQERANFHILVSDNSTEPAAIARLAEFCKSVNDPRLHYTKPPAPLPMTPHWDWALRQALDRYDASHVTFLTDRMIFKPHALRALADIATQAPTQIISYMHDRVVDNQQPVEVDQHSWTGKLFSVSATRLLELSSQSVLHEMLPRMLNTLVPRTLLNSLGHRYGKFFDSHAPDFNFCYRALEIEESIIFYDAALLIHYALDRSNGASASSGVSGQDRDDFVSDLRKSHGYFAAPIPEILTARNSIAHEYCVARNETQSAKFPVLDMPSYLKAIAGEVSEMTNQQLRREAEDALAAKGAVQPRRPLSLAQKLVSPGIVARKVAREARMLRALAFKNGAFAGDAPKFGTLEAALAYAVNSPRPRVESQPALEELFGLTPLPLEVPLSTVASY